MGESEEEIPSEIDPASLRKVEQWLLSARLERDLGEATIKAYRRDLELLLKCLPSLGCTIRDAEAKDLVAFLAHRRTVAKDARTTQARRTAALRSFFTYLVESGLRERNPTLLLPAIKPAALLPKALSIDEVRGLLEAPKAVDPATSLSLRDGAALELLYGCGLRASELAGIKLRDLDHKARMLTVFGKGRKERRLPVGEQALNAVDQYLARGRPALASPTSDSVLFLTTRGKPLSRAGVWSLVKSWGKRSGLGKELSPHTLRHSFATHLVKNGADLRAVQELLGHASIDTTQIYTTLAQDHLQAAHRRHHPRG